MGLLAERLGQNLRRWGRWAERQGTGCYRLYDHDLADYPFTLDLFELLPAGRALVLVLPDRSSGNVDELWEEMQASVQPDQLFVKRRKPAGAQAHTQEWSTEGGPWIVSEGPRRFEVDFRRDRDIGLRLEHRGARNWLAQRCRGTFVLQLFSGPGSFAVTAAAAGARSVACMDACEKSLDWSRRNFRANGINIFEGHHFYHADVFQGLKRSKLDYNWIVCEPPAASLEFDLRLDYRQLLKLCLAHLSVGGKLLWIVGDPGFHLDLAEFPMEDVTAQMRNEDCRRAATFRYWVSASATS